MQPLTDNAIQYVNLDSALNPSPQTNGHLQESNRQAPTFSLEQRNNTGIEPLSAQEIEEYVKRQDADTFSVSDIEAYYESLWQS